MPHITKWQEKRQCVKFKFEQENLEPSQPLGTLTYQLIEDMMNELLPRGNSEWFDQFVETKNINNDMNV